MERPEWQKSLGRGVLNDTTSTRATDDVADPTVISAAPPLRPHDPKHTQVLARRYELDRCYASDALTRSFLGFDREASQPVLVHILRANVVPERQHRHDALESLRAVVGVSHRFVPGLTDADEEGDEIFVVEPGPRGVNFRELLERRVTEGRSFTPMELVPVVAQLSAALDATQTPLVHGDIRPVRLWLSNDGVHLSAPYLMAVIPPARLSTILRGDHTLSRAFAPELAKGKCNRASDRYSVALLVYQALTGRTLDAESWSAVRIQSPLAEVLDELLREQPEERPVSLAGMIAALAEISGLGLPGFERGPAATPLSFSMTPTRLTRDLGEDAGNHGVTTEVAMPDHLSDDDVFGARATSKFSSSPVIAAEELPEDFDLPRRDDSTTNRWMRPDIVGRLTGSAASAAETQTAFEAGSKSAVGEAATPPAAADRLVAPAEAAATSSLARAIVSLKERQGPRRTTPAPDEASVDLAQTPPAARAQPATSAPLSNSSPLSNPREQKATRAKDAPVELKSSSERGGSSRLASHERLDVFDANFSEATPTAVSAPPSHAWQEDTAIVDMDGIDDLRVPDRSHPPAASRWLMGLILGLALLLASLLIAGGLWIAETRRTDAVRERALHERFQLLQQPVPKAPTRHR